MTSVICSIREADLNSSAAIASIYNQYVGKTTMDVEEKKSDYFEAFILRKGDKEKLYIAEVNAQVAGYGVIKQYSDRIGYQYTAETSTYLDEGYTGKGIGSKLQEHLLNQSKELGLRHLVAKIWALNEGSISFHKRHGYNIVGTQRQVGYVNGEWKDVTIMECLL